MSNLIIIQRESQSQSHLVYQIEVASCCHWASPGNTLLSLRLPFGCCFFLHCLWEYLIKQDVLAFFFRRAWCCVLYWATSLFFHWVTNFLLFLNPINTIWAWSLQEADMHRSTRLPAHYTFRKLPSHKNLCHEAPGLCSYWVSRGLVTFTHYWLHVVPNKQFQFAIIPLRVEIWNMKHRGGKKFHKPTRCSGAIRLQHHTGIQWMTHV